MNKQSPTLRNRFAMQFGTFGRSGKLKYSNHVIAVDSIADASAKWCQMRDTHGLGASQSPIVVVVDTVVGASVAKISYNGRMWAVDGSEICVS